MDSLSFVYKLIRYRIQTWEFIKNYFIEKDFKPIYCNEDHNISVFEKESYRYLLVYIPSKTYPILSSPSAEYVKQIIDGLKVLCEEFGYNIHLTLVIMPAPPYTMRFSQLKLLPKHPLYVHITGSQRDKSGFLFKSWNLKSLIRTHSDSIIPHSIDYYDEEASIMRNLELGSGDLHGL